MDGNNGQEGDFFYKHEGKDDELKFPGKEKELKNPCKADELKKRDISEIELERILTEASLARGIGGGNSGHSIDENAKIEEIPYEILDTRRKYNIPRKLENQHLIRNGIIRTLGIALVTAGLVIVNTYLHNNYLGHDDSGLLRNNIESSKDTSNDIILYGGALSALISAGYVLKKKFR